MTIAPPRGRPQASSREMLQEAAFELFLENGYEATTVSQIAQRAGVSRNTFFNYFAGKSDVFWIDLDASLGVVSARLLAASPATPALVAVREALVEGARELGPGRVPWALTQSELIGGANDLQSSAISRLSEQFRGIEHFLVSRTAATALIAKTASYAMLGAAVAAVQTWAAEGTSRGTLEPYLLDALDPVCDTFGAVFGEQSTTRP